MGENVNNYSGEQKTRPTAAQSEPEGYTDKRGVAKQLGRTPRTVDTYMALGIIPYYKIGRSVLFKWSEVDQHIKAHFRVCLRS